MRPMKITSSQSAFFIVTLSLYFFEIKADAQLMGGGCQKKDTIAILDNRLEIVLKDAAFEEIPNDLLVEKYSRSFGIGQLVNAYGLVLRVGDTLAFYQTSIDRLGVDDGGISTWKIINLFADKVPTSHWVESGWNTAGRDFIYFVKLISDEEIKQYFEFNFFFIENKLTFSLHQRPLNLKYFTDQKKYVILWAK